MWRVGPNDWASKIDIHRPKHCFGAHVLRRPSIDLQHCSKFFVITTRFVLVPPPCCYLPPAHGAACAGLYAQGSRVLLFLKTSKIVMPLFSACLA